ncbi:MAG: MBL fold metallo-hydrolase [Planctomycetota bacterium]|nr:MBL fold metallo-hydrolase [Planctomycetota bacterium]
MLATLLLFFGAACAVPGSADSGHSVRVVVLGTAQDGGLPQIGCEEEACRAARRHIALRRLVTSLLLVDERSGRRWLLDASPDLSEQVERMRGHPAGRTNAAADGTRLPIVDGIFLTHAHMGHYTGLLHLGREAYGASGVTTFASASMAAFLAGNGPWSLMVETGALELVTLEPDVLVRLADDLTVTPIEVPHRPELSNTLAFVIRGPERALLYLPDIDKWERWDRRIEDLIAEVDVALLDGTFFAEGEVPGRDMAEIPHPFMVESLARFADLPAAERAKIVFTHLNHTNPAADPSSEAARSVVRAGMWIARDGQVFGL